MIKGTNVILRPVRLSEVPILSQWINDESNDSFTNFGLIYERAFEKGFNENGLVSPKSGVLMIENYEGKLVGNVGYNQISRSPNGASFAFSIGIIVVLDYRKQGYGTEAQKLLTEYLFSTFPIMRVEAETDAGNEAERRALEKAGFELEGVLRKAQWRNGSWHDLAMYSRIR
jgi:RimJ/RimL family protein N-acetyltransferase